MALRDDVLPIINDGWSLAAEFWYTTYTVKVRTRTWTPRIGVGTYTDSDLTITPNPPVKEQSERVIVVGPVIPSHATGGYTMQQLNPAAYLANTNTTVEILHVVTNEDGTARDYLLTHIDSGDPGEFMLTLETLDRRVTT
jgi:hypothetical protein